MTGFFIFNLALSALVLAVIVGGLAWAIATSRLQSIMAAAG
ncbi:MAG TPA: hypothetical protein VMF57_09055 [Solirubrobacteraceae bacterium]|nr:hypothetical protein [Solirubrobacteraceae bacterium]